MSNAQDSVTSKVLPALEGGLVPFTDVNVVHTKFAWIVTVLSALGMLGIILSRFLTHSYMLHDWIDYMTLTPIVIFACWLLFFFSAVGRACLGRKSAREPESFRADLFIASIKLSIAGSIYSTFWLIFLFLARFGLEHRLPILLSLMKLASTHLLYAAIFRSEVESCLVNVTVGASYISLGAVAFFADDADLLRVADFCLAGGWGVISIIVFIYRRWVVSLSGMFLAICFLMGALDQSRYAIAVASLAGLVSFLSVKLLTVVEGLSSVISLLFGSWAKSQPDGLYSSSSSGDQLVDPSIPEGEPLLSGRNEQFIVIKS